MSGSASLSSAPPPPSSPPAGIPELIDAMLDQACLHPPPALITPPIVDLASPSASDDLTVVRDLRSLPPSQDLDAPLTRTSSSVAAVVNALDELDDNDNHDYDDNGDDDNNDLDDNDDDDDVQIVSAAFVSVPINLDSVVNVEAADSTYHSMPLPHTPFSDQNMTDLLAAASGIDRLPDANAMGASPDPLPPPPPPPQVCIGDGDDDVVECLAPPRRPRVRATCDACTAVCRGGAAAVLTRCKHALCAACALCAVATEEGTGERATRAVPTCVVPRCRAPLSAEEADMGLADGRADEAFRRGWDAYREWRGGGGGGEVEFPAFEAEGMAVVMEGEEVFLNDDVAAACEALWVFDEAAERGEGGWVCAACGVYERSGMRAETPMSGSDEIEEVEVEVVPDVASPTHPHCAYARALGLEEHVRGLAYVWDDEKQRAINREESEAKAAEAVRRRSKRLRWRSATSIRMAKKRKVAAKKGGFAKGTGYAGASGSEWKGTSDRLREETAKLDAEATYWLVRLRCFLIRPMNMQLDSWPGFMRLLLRECGLVGLLAKILINESIMDVFGRIPVFYAALRLVHALTESPSLRELVTAPCDGDRGRSIVELVESLSKQAAFFSTGAGEGGVSDSNAFLIKQIRKCIRVIYRQNLLQVARNRSVAACPVDLDEVEDGGVVQVERDNEASEIGAGASLGDGAGSSARPVPNISFETDRANYIKQMREHQFQAVPGLAASSSFLHEASRSAFAGNPQGKRQRRIASEVASLFSSMPLSWSSSILLRVDEDRYDFLRACIFGPEDTPYDSGAFVFDIFLPMAYPHQPPKFKLLTTGGGRVRFNPNLYNNGKVCLSLLGTWSGPSWTSASTILQVLVSIQSLILVPDPYFNEPGFESSMGTDNGKRSSARYNERVRYDTAVHAIQANLRHPTPELQAGIMAHFRLKRRYLVHSMRLWFSYASDNGAVLRAGSVFGEAANGLKEDGKKPVAVDPGVATAKKNHRQRMIDFVEKSLGQPRAKSLAQARQAAKLTSKQMTANSDEVVKQTNFSNGVLASSSSQPMPSTPYGSGLAPLGGFASSPPVESAGTRATHEFINGQLKTDSEEVKEAFTKLEHVAFEQHLNQDLAAMTDSMPIGGTQESTMSSGWPSLSVFGIGRRYGAPKMTKELLEKIISGLEAIPS